LPHPTARSQFQSNNLIAHPQHISQQKNLKEKTMPNCTGYGLQGFSFVRAFRTHANHPQKPRTAHFGNPFF